MASPPEPTEELEEGAPLQGLGAMSTVDIRRARETASLLLLFISVVGQPLVYAHMNGFSIAGITSPTRAARSICMAAVQQVVEACAPLLCYAFMVGAYSQGARLFTAPRSPPSRRLS